MNLRYRGLGIDQFTHLFGQSNEALAIQNARRTIVDEKPGFPCRVTLEDAEPGESVLLLPFEHQPARSPYRAAGPIFVREGDCKTFDRVDTPPPFLAGRLLSVRAYDAEGIMLDADVAEGREVEPLLRRLLANPDTDYLHVHFARRGCFACRVERA